MAVVYFFCITPDVIDVLKENLPENTEPKIIADEEAFGEFAAETEPGLPCDMAFCGSNTEEVQPIELGQSVRMFFPEAKLYYIANSGKNYRRDEMIKNGFDDAFLLPIDVEELKGKIEEASVGTDAQKESYRSVKLFDIGSDEPFDFDLFLYLPTNKKYVRYIGAGGDISEEQLNRLKEHQVGSAHVRLEELGKFYSYTADRLKKLTGKDDALSETERQERVKNAVRGIFSRIFDDTNSSMGEGKALTEEAQGIVSAYMEGSPFEEAYQKVMNQISDSKTHYSHNLNVSIYASLFAMVTGLGKPEELSIAGLLHDLGELDLPEGLADKPIGSMNLEEKTLYEEHPSASLKIIRERKLVISEPARKAILQHHERADGTGFPKGAQGSVISIEAQILGLADEFDLLTRHREERPAMKPYQVIDLFRDGKKFSLDLVLPLIDLFPRTDAQE